MANNQASSRHLQLDDYDFNSDFDFDFDFDLTPKPPKDKREAIWRVTTSAGKSLTNSLKSPTFFQSIVKKSLPREYGQAWDLAEKSVGTLRDLYNDSVKELRPALRDLARTTEKLMPTAEKYLPKKVADELKQFTTRYGARSNDMTGLASRSEEDMAVADILGKMYRFNAESESKRTAQGDIKEHIRENIQQERHLDQISQLDNIRSNINQMAAYQRKVEYNYHRKSLELQARSYFVQVETLREAKRQNVRTTEHLSAILHNSALPDYVKMKTSEQFMQQTKSKLMSGLTNNLTGALSNSLFGRRANFIGNLREGFKQQADVSIKNASHGLRQGLFGLDTMIDDLTREDSAIDKYTAAGHFVGSSISKFLNNQISKRLGNRIENDPNGWGSRVRRFGNKLQYGVENAPQHLAGFANTTNSAEDYIQSVLDSINNKFNDPISYKWQRRITGVAGKIGNPLLDFARDGLRRTQNYDTQIKEGNLGSLTEPAVFTNHARKSITEIIPGYLARIHQELRILRTGDTGIDLVQYDFDKNTFDSSANIKKSVFNKLVSKNDIENTNRDLDRVLSMLDPEGTLTSKQRKVLSNRLLQDNLSGSVGKAGSLHRYSRVSQFGNSDEERKHAATFAKLFKALKDSDTDGLKQIEFAQRFSRVGQSSQDVSALIQQYADMGGRPMLEEMGVLTSGSDKINRQRLIEFQSGRGFTARATRAGGVVTNTPRLTHTPPIVPHDEGPAIHQGVDLEPVTKGLRELSRDLVALDPRPKLTDIHDTLKLMQARLEEGILTVPYEQIMSELQRIRGGASGQRPGILRRAARSVTSMGGLLTMSLGDLIKGSAKLAGKGIGAASWLGNQIAGGALRTAGSLAKGIASIGFTGVSTVAGNAYRRSRGFIDIYVGNERKPRMYGRMMQEGNVYFDKETNKPIRHLKDITGTVVSRIAGEEKVVLEEDEIDQAWQKEGGVKKLIKTLGAVAKGASKVGGTLFGIATGGLPLVYRAGIWGLKKAYDLLDMPQDVYVKGGDGNPVLLARVMRGGGYRSATTGKVITRPSQIDGPVLVGSGDSEETALSHDDIRKGLLDSHGKPLRTGLAKLFGLAFGGVSTAMKVASWAGKKIGNAAFGLLKGGVRLGKNLAKTGINLAGFGLDLMRGKPFFEGMYGQAVMAGLQTQHEGNSYLKEIRDILDQRLKDPKKHDSTDADGDGVRDGSYDDEQKKEKAKKKQEEDTKAKNTAGQAGAAGGGMFGGMKAMWDKFRGKKKDGEDEDGVNVDINGVNTGGNSRDERRQRRLNRLKPKGFWGNIKHYSGRIGRGAFKLLNGPVGIGLSLLGGETLAGLAMGAGGLLASGAATAGTALAAGAGAVATGIGALFSAPVLLGIAAVAAVGIGGYLAYKALTKRRLGLLSRVRYVQYGFSPMDKDHVDAVFALEDALKDAIVYGENGAQIADKKFDVVKILKLFDIDHTDKAAVSSWANWFSNRFKPVFLTHVTALRTTVANKWLSDVDSLELPLKKKYFQASKFPEGPYGVTDSPFKDLKALPSGSGDVRAIVQIVETELNAQTKIDDKAMKTGVAGVAGAAATAASKPNAKQTDATAATKNGINSSVLTAAAAGAMNTTGLGDARGQVTIVGSSVVLESLNSGRIDPITAVRLKTYGLAKMESDKVRILLALEKTVGKDVVFTNKIATWSGSLESILKNAAPGFGVEISDGEASKNWLMWFNRRFLPTFLNYITAVTAQTGKQDYEAAVSTLKPLQMTDVATAIYTSTTKSDGTTRSVWTVTASPWPNYELATDVKIVDPNMQGLKEMSKNAILPESGSKQPSKNVTTPAAGASSAQGNKSETGIGAWISGAATKIKNIFTGGSTESTSNSGNMDGGRKLDQPGKGTGGDINAIPVPKGNKSWAALKDTILAAAKMVGVDGKLMAAMAALESGFDYTVKAGSSSAAGLFQFIDSTWKWMLKHFGAKYGINPSTPQTDPRANALMGAEYIKLNTEDLQRGLGRSLTDTDLYFAHFLGSGGATKFLKANPNAVAADLFPDAARANKSIFYAKDGSPLSVGQVYQLVNNRVRTRGKSYGIEDGSEELVTQTKPAASNAGGSSDTSKIPAKTDTATVPVAEAATTATTKTGIGAPTTPTSVEKAAPPVSQAKPATDIPLSADLGGFTAPARAMRDITNQAQMQQELKVTDMDTVNKTLNDSLEVQKVISSTLSKILAAVGNSNQANNNPTQGNAAQQASNMSQPDRTRAPMRPSPVSMSRTMLNN